MATSSSFVSRFVPERYDTNNFWKDVGTIASALGAIKEGGVYTYTYSLCLDIDERRLATKLISSSPEGSKTSKTARMWSFLSAVGETLGGAFGEYNHNSKVITKYLDTMIISLSKDGFSPSITTERQKNILQLCILSLDYLAKNKDAKENEEDKELAKKELELRAELITKFETILPQVTAAVADK